MRIFILAGSAILLAAPAFAQDSCAGSHDLRLTNGRIHTMNGADTVVSEVVIQDGKFAAVGPTRDLKLSPCTKTINLGGRTVVPGLIDNHNHIVLLGLRPGHDLRLETAANIAEVQAAVKARAAEVPKGEFVTAMGGWNVAQFAEKRMPTLEELDAATSDHPVLLYQSFTGPAATNSAGRAFFTSKGVMVGANGSIGANAPSLAALNALRAAQTFDDKKRGTLDAMNYATSMGITTSVDMGAFNIPGTPDLQDAFIFDGLASSNPFTHVRRLHGPSSRRQDDLAPAHLLPEHGYPPRRSPFKRTRPQHSAQPGR